MNFAIAAAALVLVACVQAGDWGHGHYAPRGPSIYNKNTNINTNKNKAEAEVWSSIWDSLYSNQDVIQQQSQAQLCKYRPQHPWCHRIHKRGADYGYDIYNVNTNKNKNQNKVEADVWSKIYDSLYASQYTNQFQQQSQQKPQPCYHC